MGYELSISADRTLDFKREIFGKKFFFKIGSRENGAAKNITIWRNKLSRTVSRHVIGFTMTLAPDWSNRDEYENGFSGYSF